MRATPDKTCEPAPSVPPSAAVAGGGASSPQRSEQPAATVFAWSDEEWLAARELRLRSRAAQGLPERVEDVVALQRAAELLRR